MLCHLSVSSTRLGTSLPTVAFRPDYHRQWQNYHWTQQLQGPSASAYWRLNSRTATQTTRNRARFAHCQCITSSEIRTTHCTYSNRMVAMHAHCAIRVGLWHPAHINHYRKYVVPAPIREWPSCKNSRCLFVCCVDTDRPVSIRFAVSIQSCVDTFCTCAK